MISLRPLLLPLLFVLGLNLARTTAQSQAFTATYDFAQANTTSGLTDPTPPPVAAGVTFGSFTATGMAGNPNASGRFSFISQPTGGLNGSDDFSQFTGSLNPTVFFEVTLTPLALIQLQLDSIGFTVQRSGTGIRSYAVRSSLDGYSTNLPASVTPANNNLGIGPGQEFRVLFDTVSTAQNGSLVPLGAPFIGLTTPVTFRFYGWNAEASTGTFSIDNVTFSGRTDSIPEPGSFALFSLGLLALGCRRRTLR